MPFALGCYVVSPGEGSVVFTDRRRAGYRTGRNATHGKEEMLYRHCSNEILTSAMIVTYEMAVIKHFMAFSESHRWNGNMPEEKDKGTTSKESQTIQKQDQALKDDKTRVRKAVETAAQENAGSSIEYESPAL